MKTAIPATLQQRLVAHARERTKDAGAAANTRPVTDYLDADRFALEKQALFHGLPIVLAHSSQLAQPGDFITDDRLGVPVLLSRTRDGSVAAHLNVCPHRGSIVENERCGHRSHFECPYHNWTFGLDGRLLRMTDEESFAGIAAEVGGLRPVAVAEKYGLVFVRIAAGGPIDIDAFLGPFAEDIANLHLEKHRYFGSRQSELHCNWKIQQEGSLETYHFNSVHGNTIARQYNGMSQVFDRFGDHQRFVVPRRKLIENVEAQRDARDQMLATYFIFPNTSIAVPHDHAMFVQVFPRGSRQCLFENALLVPEGVDKETGHWQRALELTQSVNVEDFAIIEGVQRGYEAGAFDRVMHGRFEQGLTAFHESIDEAIERHLAANARSADA